MVFGCDYEHTLCDIEHNSRKKLRFREKKFIFLSVNAIINETTAENLKELRSENDLNQDDLALILGISRNAVSKIETGTRLLSETEKKILDWYFFGTIPERLTSGILSADMLDFTATEWNVISSIARRIGVSPSKWIVDQIRGWLVRDEMQKAPTFRVAEAMGNELSHSTGASSAPMKYPSGHKPRQKKNGTKH